MKTEPITIDGVAGPIVVTAPAFWGKPAVTVGDRPVPRGPFARYALPATVGGTVNATVRMWFTDAYPSVEINGVRHRTGPKVPVVLHVLACLPILLAIIGGAIGGLIAALSLFANLAVARTQLPSAVKALIMIGVGLVASVVWLAIAVAISPS